MANHVRLPVAAIGLALVLLAGCSNTGAGNTNDGTGAGAPGASTGANSTGRSNAANGANAGASDTSRASGNGQTTTGR